MGVRYRSEDYRRIKEEVEKDYSNDRWAFAKRWRSRVGFPRLIAESLAYTAYRVLHDLSANIFRNDPKGQALLALAREATNGLHAHLTRVNWNRFEGKPDDAE